VWDQNRETAIRLPRGGPKITWGGEDVAARLSPHRIHFDIAINDSIDPNSEIDRLCDLGAKRLESEHSESRGVTMADPDGNQFCLLAHQSERA
jgi:hypothetical protein